MSMTNTESKQNEISGKEQINIDNTKLSNPSKRTVSDMSTTSKQTAAPTSSTILTSSEPKRSVSEKTIVVKDKELENSKEESKNVSYTASVKAKDLKKAKSPSPKKKVQTKKSKKVSWKKEPEIVDVDSYKEYNLATQNNPQFTAAKKEETHCTCIVF